MAPNHVFDSDSTVSVAQEPLTPNVDKPKTRYVNLQDEDTETTNDLVDTSLAATHPHLRECLAEAFGTFIMVAFGFGVNNQVERSLETHGTWLSINMCWGIAVMLGVHCAEGVSGSDLNPAVSLTKAVFHRLAWWKVPGYVLAQTLGAFTGAVLIFFMYKPWIELRDPEYAFTHHAFVTHPNDLISNVTAFYTELFATAMLTIGVFCITDKRNRPASAFGAPVHFMLLIWAIGMAFGINTGYAINPARDFGPRVFTSLAGWGSKVFTENGHYFWIPIVAPSLGGPLGGLLYKLFVENHHPRRVVSELPV